MVKKTQQKKKKKSNNVLTRTPKSNIMRGVGKYSKGQKITRTLKGRGGFFEDMGGKAGQWLGSKAGGLLSSIFGVGSYQVSKNSLTASASDPPQVTNTKGATRVQHREFIQDISGSTAFAIQSFPVNPGLWGTFPWLASVANNFEEYVLHGLLFEFKSTSASALNSTNTALGTVIMATEYNALHPDFVSKRDMENYVYSTSCSPDMSALHPVECARDVNVLSELYVRNVPPSLPTDLRFSDLGRFQIATVGMQAAAVIGELWVTYDIELIKPKLPDAYTSIGPSHYTFSTTDVIPNPLPAAPTAANLFGLNSEKVGLRGVGLSAVNLSTNTITFTASGRYLIALNIYVTAAGANVPVTTANSLNVTDVFMFHNGSTSGGLAVAQIPRNYAAVTTDNFATLVCVDVVVGQTAAPSVTFISGTITTAVLGMDLYIIPLPSGFQKVEVRDPLGYLNQQIDLIKKSFTRLYNEVERHESESIMVNPQSNHVTHEVTTTPSSFMTTVLNPFGSGR